jgi:hypothetical protein
MCFGGTQAPQIVYSGPSAADIEAQSKQLQQYKEQSATQQEQFAAGLQRQIDATNTQAEQQRQQLERERTAQRTKAAEPKKKPKSSLSIATGSVESTAGSGLNIGV